MHVKGDPRHETHEYFNKMHTFSSYILGTHKLHSLHNFFTQLQQFMTNQTHHILNLIYLLLYAASTPDFRCKRFKFSDTLLSPAVVALQTTACLIS